MQHKGGGGQVKKKRKEKERKFWAWYFEFHFGLVTAGWASLSRRCGVRSFWVWCCLNAQHRASICFANGLAEREKTDSCSARDCEQLRQSQTFPVIILLFLMFLIIYISFVLLLGAVHCAYTVLCTVLCAYTVLCTVHTLCCALSGLGRCSAAMWPNWKSAVTLYCLNKQTNRRLLHSH